MFRLAGNVVAVELSRDKENKSRGFAVIVYDHPVEAVQERRRALFCAVINDKKSFKGTYKKTPF